jgi:hypothetical protein
MGSILLYLAACSSALAVAQNEDTVECFFFAFCIFAFYCVVSFRGLSGRRIRRRVVSLVK